MKCVSNNLEETKQCAKELIELAKKSMSSKGTTLIGLSGNLGSGKTTLTKYIAEILGADGEVTSPTFIFAEEYKTKDQTFESLIHLDMYRLEEGEKTGFLELDDLFQREKSLIIIEWPERIKDSLPENLILIKAEADNTTHTFYI